MEVQILSLNGNAFLENFLRGSNEIFERNNCYAVAVSLSMDRLFLELQIAEGGKGPERVQQTGCLPCVPWVQVQSSYHVRCSKHYQE